MGIIVGGKNPKHIKSEDLGKSDARQVLRNEADNNKHGEDYSQLSLKQTLNSVNQK